MLLQTYAHRLTLPLTPGLPANTRDVFEDVSHLEALYPGFRSWFFEKAARSTLQEERRFFVRFECGRLAGVAIAKRAAEERKLCTLWVHPRVRKQGLGRVLAEEALDWLGTQTPLFTVPQRRSHYFTSLMSDLGFKQTQALPGHYLANDTELVFNGRLVCRLQS